MYKVRSLFISKMFYHKNSWSFEAITYGFRMVRITNSLWPSDAIWWQRSGSTLAQVMAWSLQAPSHYLNQCWLISDIHIRAISQEMPLPSITENYISKISFKFPRGQWVKFDRHRGTVAETPVKFKVDMLISTTNLAALRLHRIWW